MQHEMKKMHQNVLWSRPLGNALILNLLQMLKTFEIVYLKTIIGKTSLKKGYGECTNWSDHSWVEKNFPKILQVRTIFTRHETPQYQDKTHHFKRQKIILASHVFKLNAFARFFWYKKCFASVKENIFQSCTSSNDPAG